MIKLSLTVLPQPAWSTLQPSVSSPVTKAEWPSKVGVKIKEKTLLKVPFLPFCLPVSLVCSPLDELEAGKGMLDVGASMAIQRSLWLWSVSDSKGFGARPNMLHCQK